MSNLDNKENVPHPLLQLILSLTKILSKFFSKITRASQRLSENDLNFERSVIFKSSKMVTLNCYRKKLEICKNKKKGKAIKPV